MLNQDVDPIESLLINTTQNEKSLKKTCKFTICSKYSFFQLFYQSADIILSDCEACDDGGEGEDDNGSKDIHTEELPEVERHIYVIHQPFCGDNSENYRASQNYRHFGNNKPDR